MRQWILLNRRVKYDPEQGGHHELWLNIGGSAGHSGLYGIDIDEGTRQEGARYWQVELISANEAYTRKNLSDSERKERAKTNERLIEFQRQCDAVMAVLSGHPEGETVRCLRDTCKIGANAIHQVMKHLHESFSLKDARFKKTTDLRTDSARWYGGVGTPDHRNQRRSAVVVPPLYIGRTTTTGGL